MIITKILNYIIKEKVKKTLPKICPLLTSPRYKRVFILTLFLISSHALCKLFYIRYRCSYLFISFSASTMSMLNMWNGVIIFDCVKSCFIFRTACEHFKSAIGAKNIKNCLVYQLWLYFCKAVRSTATPKLTSSFVIHMGGLIRKT